MLTVINCEFLRHLHVCNLSYFRDQNHCSDHQRRYLCCSCDHMNRLGFPYSCERTSWLPHLCYSCVHTSRLNRQFQRHPMKLVNDAPPLHACNHRAYLLWTMRNHALSWRIHNHCLPACWAQQNNRLLHFVWCQRHYILHVYLSSPNALNWNSPPSYASNLKVCYNHHVSCHKNWCCQENILVNC